jgi:uncharacterized protein YuzE
MKLSYDRDEDILLIETSAAGKIDHAEHTGPIIAHFTESGEVSLLEILHATDFLATVIRATTRGEAVQIPEPAAGSPSA